MRPQIDVFQLPYVVKISATLKSFRPTLGTPASDLEVNFQEIFSKKNFQEAPKTVLA